MSKRRRKARTSKIGMFPIVATSRVRRARKKALKSRCCSAYNSSVHISKEPTSAKTSGIEGV